ncbi:MAG: gamma-glutamyl-gamma-aminobutyrate hydrolase family protein [Bacteroidales bacterium]|nr:gamma-glutamyl-gamma-aminobutyrate hydrolase family protein [Bacteroidales bacterium]
MRKICSFSLLILLLTACGTSRAPLIGITCSRSTSGATLLATTYTEAITRAGGVAVVLPAVASAEEAGRLLDALDGIVFSGGEDVSPAWYGEPVWNETVYVDTLRDRSDSLLARAALASGKPVLAICRGAQLMNVVMGGSLYQDLPTQLGSEVVHGGGAVHPVTLAPGGLLRELFGADTLHVNSFHHQAVKDAAPGLTVTARSEDGVVEAYEAPRVWAVQFHPEKMLQEGQERWLPFFVHFVGICRETPSK